jgi:hypothetical protein
MKKKAIIILSLVLTITFILYIWVDQYFFTLDTKIQYQLEEEFTKDFFDFSHLEIEETEDWDGALANEFDQSTNEPSTTTQSESGNTSSVDHHSADHHSAKNNSSKSNSTEQKSSPQETAQTPPSNANSKNNISTIRNTSAREPLTETEIRNKYLPIFKELESEAIYRIEILFDSAYKEYKQKRKDGTLNKTDLARKYLQAATQLENSVNATFNSLASKMKKELTQNNLSDQLVKEARQHYEEAIRSKKTEFLQKVSNK